MSNKRVATVALLLALFSFEGCLIVSQTPILGRVHAGGMVLFYCVFPNLFAAICFTFLPLRRYAKATLLIIFIFITGLSIRNGWIWYNVNVEISDLVKGIDGSVEKRVPDPRAVNQIALKKTFLKDRFHEIILEGNDFTIYYNVVRPEISHWYSSKVGWGHSDD